LALSLVGVAGSGRFALVLSHLTPEVALPFELILSDLTLLLEPLTIPLSLCDKQLKEAAWGLLPTCDGFLLASLGM
jgi:hypothetical protein